MGRNRLVKRSELNKPAFKKNDIKYDTRAGKLRGLYFHIYGDQPANDKMPGQVEPKIGRGKRKR